MLSSLALAFSGAPTKDAVHPERVAQIAHLDKHATWKAAAHPRFAADAPGASSSLMGVKGNWVEDLREAVRQGEVEEYAPHPDTLAVAVPDSFDSATNWPSCGKTLNDVRDQSNCGCCWAFGGAEAASDRMCIATKGKLQMPLSANDVCFNAGGFLSSGCNGGQISTLTLPLTLTLTTPPPPHPLHPHHSSLTTQPSPSPLILTLTLTLILTPARWPDLDAVVLHQVARRCHRRYATQGSNPARTSPATHARGPHRG